MGGVFDLDTIGMIVGAVITLMIFSYLLGDNFLYRWALALLVGSTVGYALGLAWQAILRDWVAMALRASGGMESARYAVPLILGALLLLKGFASSRLLGRLAVLGNIPLAYLIGVGAGVAVAGALLGTIIPQVTAAGAPLMVDRGLSGLILGPIVLIGTIAALLVFSPQLAAVGGKLAGLLVWLRRGGRFFIAIALGVTFAAAITTALTTFVLRLWDLAGLLSRLFTLTGG
jgi:hypothetical protein